MNINWKDKDSVFNAFSDICEVIDSTHSFDEGYASCQQFDALLKEYADNIPDEIAFDTDFLIRLIKRSGRLYMLVPEERFFDKELLLAVLPTDRWQTYNGQFGTILNGSNDASYYLKVVPKETFNDREFALDGIKLYPGIYEYLPDDLKRDEEILNVALHFDWRNIHYIPKDVHIDRNIAIKAVQEDGWNIGYLPHEYDNDLELLYMAVRENPYSFRDASDIFRKDVDLTLKMIKEENVPYKEADDSLWKNFHFALEMFKLFGTKVLSDIDWDSWKFDEQYAFAKEIVAINPSSIVYLPEGVKDLDGVSEDGELMKIKAKAEAELLEQKSKKTEEEKGLDKRWDDFLNNLFISRSMDVDEFQALFFDTFWYFRNRKDPLILNAGGWHILSCLSAFRKMPLDFYPEDCLLNEFNAARCLCEDLLFEINHGMPGYYTESSFVILNSCDPPAGCSELSACMDDLETFGYEFYKVVSEFDEWFDGWRSENYTGRYYMAFSESSY